MTWPRIPRRLFQLETRRPRNSRRPQRYIADERSPFSARDACARLTTISAVRHSHLGATPGTGFGVAAGSWISPAGYLRLAGLGADLQPAAQCGVLQWLHSPKDSAQTSAELYLFGATSPGEA